MNKVDRIIKRQTTFWDFRSDNGLIRVHFKGKQEHHFVSPDVSGFEIVRKHPVLMDYEYAWQEIFIASSPAQPTPFLEKIYSAVAGGTADWRAPEHYLNQYYDPVKLLHSGHGHLFSGPEPLVARVSDVLAKEKIEFSVLKGHKARWPMEALIAGKNFAVAKSFRLDS